MILKFDLLLIGLSSLFYASAHLPDVIEPGSIGPPALSGKNSLSLDLTLATPSDTTTLPKVLDDEKRLNFDADNDPSLDLKLGLPEIINHPNAVAPGQFPHTNSPSSMVSHQPLRQQLGNSNVNTEKLRDKKRKVPDPDIEPAQIRVRQNQHLTMRFSHPNEFPIQKHKNIVHLESEQDANTFARDVNILTTPTNSGSQHANARFYKTSSPLLADRTSAIWMNSFAYPNGAKFPSEIAPQNIQFDPIGHAGNLNPNRLRNYSGNLPLKQHRQNVALESEQDKELLARNVDILTTNRQGPSQKGKEKVPTGSSQGFLGEIRANEIISSIPKMDINALETSILRQSSKKVVLAIDPIALAARRYDGEKSHILAVEEMTKKNTPKRMIQKFFHPHLLDRGSNSQYHSLFACYEMIGSEIIVKKSIPTPAYYTQDFKSLNKCYRYFTANALVTFIEVMQRISSPALYESPEALAEAQSQAVGELAEFWQEYDGKLDSQSSSQSSKLKPWFLTSSEKTAITSHLESKCFDQCQIVRLSQTIFLMWIRKFLDFYEKLTSQEKPFQWNANVIGMLNAKLLSWNTIHEIKAKIPSYGGRLERSTFLTDMYRYYEPVKPIWIKWV